MIELGNEGVCLGKAKIIRKSSKALLVQLEHEKAPRWLPKSVIHDDSELYFNDDGDYSEEGTLIVKQWFAEKEGLA